MAKEVNYQRRIARALDRAYARIEKPEKPLELNGIRCVIFSDHHRGQRDGADDFHVCERAYHAALGYYYEKDYVLVVLGDVEELWECRPKKVIRAYSETIGLEEEFFRIGHYKRIYGNHDDLWRYSGAVRKHLWPQYGEALIVWGGLKLEITHQGQPLGTIFLTHGHQGTLCSDILGPVSRIFVRFFWRPFQRITRLPKTNKTAAQHFGLRQRHNAAMYLWAHGKNAGGNGLILIAGHTHKPVFLTEPSTEKAKKLYEEACNAPNPDKEEIAKRRAALEFAIARERFRFSELEPGLRPPTPCYFNTGCCSYGDGDVTGIEVVDGKIRLVKWANDPDKLVPQVRAEISILDVFNRL